MPNVSIVIPAYNEEDAIGRCLSRLTPQLDESDEVIVLDNGSTDRTAPVASTFEDVTVMHVPDESLADDGHVRGLSRLRQFGAERATNEVIATTDADTLPPDDWLDRIKAHFESDPELTVLWGIATDTNGVPVRDLTGKYLTFLGGVSGCNTAFRKEAFEALDRGYVGWPMFEDVAVITRLARTGKAKHDTSLAMRTDLDRRRYQTIPMLGLGAAGVGAGAIIGGSTGGLAAGAGLGLAGTEAVYERFPETRFHHDQIGLAMVLAGTLLGGIPGATAAGVGSGVLAHHLLTEGVSALPTRLFANTDQVCHIPDEDGDPVTKLVCAPSDESPALTRVLAAATVGGVLAKGSQALRARANR